MYIQLPYCDETAVSVSCLDLCYAIKFKDNKALKDERKDKTAPVVLQNLDEDDSSSESEEGMLIGMELITQMSYDFKRGRIE